MFIWSKNASAWWLQQHEIDLAARGQNDLAVIERPGRKRLRVEVACKSRTCANRLLREFGGRAEKLPRDWLKRISREQKTKPLWIGKRLLISASRSGDFQTAGAIRRPPFLGKGPSHLVIPAGAAFGTGEHVTTVMSLRLLERITRAMKPGWSLLDLGTGSGILALAAKCSGAGHVLGIDNDVRAIATAKENARINKIDKIDFRIADVREWRPLAKIDILTANLFSELLIEIVPKLGKNLNLDGRLILSGVLRNQERDLVRALKRNKIDITGVRRRGKWVAILAHIRR